MINKTLFLITLLLAPALVFAVPLPRPRGGVEYRFVARHVKVGESCPDVPFKATRHPDWLMLQRDGGRQSIEVLVGPEIHGDFEASLEFEVAGFRALGIRPNGGTPVPYYGFRGTNGKVEEYFTLHTAMQGWETFTVHIRREGEKVIANRAGHDHRGSSQGCRGPGYIMFLMNDIAKLKVLRFEVQMISKDSVAIKPIK